MAPPQPHQVGGERGEQTGVEGQVGDRDDRVDARAPDLVGLVAAQRHDVVAGAQRASEHRDGGRDGLDLESASGLPVQRRHEAVPAGECDGGGGERGAGEGEAERRGDLLPSGARQEGRPQQRGPQLHRRARGGERAGRDVVPPQQEDDRPAGEDARDEVEAQISGGPDEGQEERPEDDGLALHHPAGVPQRPGEGRVDGQHHEREDDDVAVLGAEAEQIGHGEQPDDRGRVLGEGAGRPGAEQHLDLLVVVDDVALRRGREEGPDAEDEQPGGEPEEQEETARLEALAGEGQRDPARDAGGQPGGGGRRRAGVDERLIRHRRAPSAAQVCRTSSVVPASARGP